MKTAANLRAPTACAAILVLLLPWSARAQAPFPPPAATDWLPGAPGDRLVIEGTGNGGTVGTFDVFVLARGRRGDAVEQVCLHFDPAQGPQPFGGRIVTWVARPDGLYERLFERADQPPLHPSVALPAGRSRDRLHLPLPVGSRLAWRTVVPLVFRVNPGVNAPGTPPGVDTAQTPPAALRWHDEIDVRLNLDERRMLLAGVERRYVSVREEYDGMIREAHLAPGLGIAGTGMQAGEYGYRTRVVARERALRDDPRPAAERLAAWQRTQGLEAARVRWFEEDLTWPWHAVRFAQIGAGEDNRIVVVPRRGDARAFDPTDVDDWNALYEDRPWLPRVAYEGPVGTDLLRTCAVAAAILERTRRFPDAPVLRRVFAAPLATNAPPVGFEVRFANPDAAPKDRPGPPRLFVDRPGPVVERVTVQGLAAVRMRQADGTDLELEVPLHLDSWRGRLTELAFSSAAPDHWPPALRERLRPR